MRRRTLLLTLAGVAGGGTLAACSVDKVFDNLPATGQSGSSAPILSSTKASTLAGQSVTAPYRPQPGRAPARAYALGRRTFMFDRGDRALPTSVWYPAKGTAAATPQATENAEPEPGRYPLILFSHGLTAQPGDYAAMLMRWAQAGFVVAGPTYPNTWYGADPLVPTDIVNQPADASHVIDLMLAQASPVTAIIDRDRIAAAGHSAGGITTVGLFSAHRDERLKAGIVFAGTDFQAQPFTGPSAALLFVHGRKDDTVSWEAGHTVFEAVPWSRAMLTVTDGGHVTGGDDFEAVTATSTEFLRYALYGDPAAKSRIPQAAATDGVATLENEL
jgi:predicted esterase